MFDFFGVRPALILLMALLFVGFGIGGSHAQDLIVEPQSLDFDSAAIGYRGEAVTNRTLTITNQSDEQMSVSFEVRPFAYINLFSFYEPEVVAVHSAIRDIYCAIGCHKQDYGWDPRSFESLQELGYININPQVSEQWRFLWDGYINPITSIWAFTLHPLPDGEDQVIQFDLQTGAFQDRDPLYHYWLETGESRSLVVSCQPAEVGEIQANILISGVGNNQVTIPLRGVGYVPETLMVSTHRLSFGSVSLTERGRMEITISNPSRLFMEYEFDYSDAEDWNVGSFDIYNSIVDDVHAAMLDIFDASQRFNSDHGEDASSVEELVEEGYLRLSEEVTRKWRFLLIGSNPITQIEAVSTAELLQGAGHTLLYDVYSRKFVGFCQSWGARLGSGREQLFIMEFIPYEIGRKEATFTINGYTELIRCASESFTTTISLTGNGVLEVPNQSETSFPRLLSLTAAYPNPFNSTTRIDYYLPTAGRVRLGLYDFNGREVGTLVNGFNSAGSHSVALNASGLAAGTYMVVIRGEGAIRWENVVLVK
ncbi:MAG: T9SS type A sorting domain-containing protein [Calditrichota bacterium]